MLEKRSWEEHPLLQILGIGIFGWYFDIFLFKLAFILIIGGFIGIVLIAPMFDKDEEEYAGALHIDNESRRSRRRRKRMEKTLLNKDDNDEYDSDIIDDAWKKSKHNIK